VKSEMPVACVFVTNGANTAILKWLECGDH
jgi:hypothetical protein